MIQTLIRFIGFLAAIVTFLIFVFALLSTLSPTQHELRPYERKHLEVAIKFIRDRELETGHIPYYAEFEEWTRKMDSDGYQFEGWGYALDYRCGSKSSEFCITFWNGDNFVSYRSWQNSMDSVRIDDSPFPRVFGYLALCLLTGLFSKHLLNPKKPSEGGHEV